MSKLIAVIDLWLAEEHRLGRLHRHSSQAIYRAMWGALCQWCLSQHPPITELAALDSTALAAYIRSREQHGQDGEALTPRYEWRLMSLVRRVQTWAAAAPRGATAADALLAQRPHVRLANAQRDAEQLEHLSAAQVRRLLMILGRQHRLAAQGALARWQDLRNATAVALQLGGGLGPGDVRALTLRDADPERSLHHALARADDAWPDVDPGPRPSAAASVRPGARLWMRVPANGSAPTHEVPLAPWAARMLAAWQRLRLELRIPGDWLLPSTRTGKPWGKVAQYEAGCAVLAAAGIPSRAAGGSFRLRHSFALRQLRRGHAPEHIAAWLGVTDPAVMQRYQRWLQQSADAVD